MRIPDWLKFSLIGLVSLAWAASILTSLISHSYHPDPSIYTPFGVIIGGLIWGGGRGGRDDR